MTFDKQTVSDILRTALQAVEDSSVNLNINSWEDLKEFIKDVWYD